MPSLKTLRLGVESDHVIPVPGSRTLPLPTTQMCWLSDADVGEGMEKSKYVAEPPQNAYDDDRVQDGLDGIGHGDKPINQRKNDPDDN